MIAIRTQKQTEEVGLIPVSVPKSSLTLSYPLKSRILLAEDDEGNGLQVREYLQNNGLVTDWCCNGLQALQYASQHQYGLAIVDSSMPYLNGTELIRKLRSEAYYAQTPIIMITGNSALEKQMGVQNLHIQCFIYKPFSLEQIANQVKRLLYSQLSR